MEQESKPKKPNPALAARAARLKREAAAKEEEAANIAAPVAKAVIAEIKGAMQDLADVAKAQGEAKALSEALQAANAKIKALTDENATLKSQADKARK